MSEIRRRLQADLPAAMKERDSDRVAVLRSTLAAIANQETVDATSSKPAVGIGTNDVARRDLSQDEVVGIVTGERDRLRELAREMGAIRQRDEAVRLENQARILDFYLTTA